MYDLAIIGAGPAGMAAAEVAAKHGMRAVIVDEQNQVGGQIFRRPPVSFSVRTWLPQRVYRNLHQLYARFIKLDKLTHLHSTAVLGIGVEERHFVLHINGPSGLEPLLASRVLVATGCFDMPLSFPGAQLPGVMATGGMQAFLKSQQIIPGERFVFIGSHPLQLIVASQIAKAGGDVAGVFFTPSLSKYLTVLRSPLVLLRQMPNLLFFLGMLAQLLLKRVPVRFGAELVSANGDNALESVVLKSNSNTTSTKSIACDRLGLCFGFLTNNDLLRQAGVECSWSQISGGWNADHDRGMRSSVPGIYVAGETTSVAGAYVAFLEGQVAALSAACDSGNIDQAAYDKASNAIHPPLKAARKFAHLLAEMSYPGEATIQRYMSDDAYLCKCEEITVGSVRATLAENPDVSDLNALKLLTRCGMGHCQGRYCHYQSRFLLARVRNVTVESMAGFTARFPIRPISIGELLRNIRTEDME
jgi:thioredoxin reductase